MLDAATLPAWIGVSESLCDDKVPDQSKENRRLHGKVGLLLRILFSLSDPFNLPELCGVFGILDSLVLQVFPLGGQDGTVLVETSRNGTGFVLNDSSVSARGG